MEKHVKNMGTVRIIIFITFFVCFLGLLFWNTRPPGTEEVILGGENIELYVAKTLKETYTGLGGRTDLDGKDGMLFLFDFPARHGIVMRNMLFSIDVVWLREGTVVDIAPALPIELGASEASLMVYRPRADADMVIELPAGWSARHDLRIGDTLSIPQ